MDPRYKSLLCNFACLRKVHVRNVPRVAGDLIDCCGEACRLVCLLKSPVIPCSIATGIALTSGFQLQCTIVTMPRVRIVLWIKMPLETCKSLGVGHRGSHRIENTVLFAVNAQRADASPSGRAGWEHPVRPLHTQSMITTEYNIFQGT
jgi:hypothetical protein